MRVIQNAYEFFGKERTSNERLNIVFLQHVVNHQIVDGSIFWEKAPADYRMAVVTGLLPPAVSAEDVDSDFNALKSLLVKKKYSEACGILVAMNITALRSGPANEFLAKGEAILLPFLEEDLVLEFTKAGPLYKRCADKLYLVTHIIFELHSLRDMAW
jgi:hypothetical protein